MEHPRIRLPFGGGLDRAAGIAVADPSRFRDVRNAYLGAGKLQARKGLEITAPASAFVDHAGAVCNDVVLVHASQTEQTGIVVAYTRATGTATLFRVSGEGTSPTRVGAAPWFTGGPAEPPRVVAAEVAGKIFLAHDEPRIALRQQTFVYDALAAPELSGLTANLDGTGPQPVRFRGVVRWLAYLFGWGFGTANQDRPEMVRASLPGQPHLFNAEHYFIAGARWEPVVACCPAGDVLLVRKAAEAQVIFGSGQTSFGIRDLEKHVGLDGSRLWVTLGEHCYFWSRGPRRSSGGPSQELGFLLDLQGEDPADLPPAGVAADGFALYRPDRKLIEFTFGRRVYVLHLTDGEPSGWTYDERPQDAFCGGILYAGGVGLTGGSGSSTPPDAFPTALGGAAGAAAASSAPATVTWTRNSAAGDEHFEVWMKPTGGSWSQRAAGRTAGANESAAVSLATGTRYDTAVRYRRGSQYTAGYTSANPEDWPAPARGTITTQLGVPTPGAATWSRTSAAAERIRVTFTPFHPDRAVEVLRGGVLAGTAPAGATEFVDATPAGESANIYTFRHKTGDATGAASPAIPAWGGPPAPLLTDVQHAEGTLYVASWTNGEASAETELWDDGGLDRTLAAGETSAGGIGSSGPEVVQVRHKLLSFGVFDHSEFSNSLVVDLP